MTPTHAVYAASARQPRRPIYDNKRLERIVPGSWNLSPDFPEAPQPFKATTGDPPIQATRCDDEALGGASEPRLHANAGDGTRVKPSNCETRPCKTRTARKCNKAPESNQDLVLWRLVLRISHGAQARKDKDLEGARPEDQKRAGNKKAGNTKDLHKSERCWTHNWLAIVAAPRTPSHPSTSRPPCHLTSLLTTRAEGSNPQNVCFAVGTTAAQLTIIPCDALLPIAFPYLPWRDCSDKRLNKRKFESSKVRPSCRSFLSKAAHINQIFEHLSFIFPVPRAMLDSAAGSHP